MGRRESRDTLSSVQPLVTVTLLETFFPELCCSFVCIGDAPCCLQRGDVFLPRSQGLLQEPVQTPTLSDNMQQPH